MTRQARRRKLLPIRAALCAAAFAGVLAGPAGTQGGTTPESDPLAVTEDGLIYNSVLSVRLPKGPEWQLLGADVSTVIFVAPSNDGGELRATLVWVPTEPAEMEAGPRPDDSEDLREVLRWGFRNVMRQQEVLDGGLEVRLSNLRAEGRTLRRLWADPLPRYGDAGELCKRYRLLAANSGSDEFEELPSDTVFIGKICMHPDLIAAILLEYGRTFVTTGGEIPEFGPEAERFLDSLVFERRAS